ncbi:hypothetical protein D3C84_1106590 [compost metagenome]
MLNDRKYRYGSPRNHIHQQNSQSGTEEIIFSPNAKTDGKWERFFKRKRASYQCVDKDGDKRTRVNRFALIQRGSNDCID